MIALKTNIFIISQQTNWIHFIQTDSANLSKPEPVTNAKEL